MTGGSSSHRYWIDFQPVGRRLEVEAGVTVLAAAQSAGVELVALCGGQGACGSCRVRLIKGLLSEPGEAERKAIGEQDISDGYRLACRARIESDVTIDIPPESLTTPQRLQIEGREVDVPLDPVVIPVDLELDPPSLEDLRGDSARLSDGIQEQGHPPPTMPLAVLSEFSDQLREQRWQARVAMRGSEVVALLPSQTPLLGLAVDIGTTKVAAYLLDLESGRTLAKAGAMNPQIGYGEDVVSRIVYAGKGREHRAELQERIVDTLNGLIVDLCERVEARPDQIVELVVVGNTAMHHLFAGLPTAQLGASPFVPSVGESMDLPAREIGLNVAPGAYVHLPPNIAGYVGADHVAMALSTEIWRTDRTVMAVDIGTNTEISLAVGDVLYSCSCASGPAFEGAHIRDGMRAAPGAIERVQITDGRVRVQTIGGRRPVGLCGSGILDAVAQMAQVGALDRSGKLQAEHPLVHRNEHHAEFLLVRGEETGHGRDVAVTQKDVHEFQLAKGAIQVGVEILLERAEIEPNELDQFIIAGAFGTYIDVEGAIRLKMFPPLPLERFHQVGNAAGAGARQMLVSGALRQTASEIKDLMTYVELARHPGFSERFMEALYL